MVQHSHLKTGYVEGQMNAFSLQHPPVLKCMYSMYMNYSYTKQKAAH